MKKRKSAKELRKMMEEIDEKIKLKNEELSNIYAGDDAACNSLCPGCKQDLNALTTAASHGLR